MTEFKEKFISIPEIDILPKVRKWESTPDAVVAEAAIAVQKQSAKPTRLVDTESQKENTGIYMLERWAEHQLLKIGQRRGMNDLVPRGSSAHNVCFGIAELRTAASAAVSTVRVAIKTFDKPRKAISEVITNQKVLERGFSTTNPICTIIDDKAFVLTLVRDDIQPLDTEPWHQFETGLPAVRNHFLSRLKAISLLIADLHARGINHSDAQIKNFWVTNTGRIEMFDWESSNIFTNPPTPDELLAMAVDDLRTLFNSLTGQYEDFSSVFTGPLIRRWNQFYQAILNPYLDRLVEKLAENNQLTQNVFDSIIAIEDNLKSGIKLS